MKIQSVNGRYILSRLIVLKDKLVYAVRRFYW